MFMSKLKLEDKEVEQEIYVARKLRRLFLGAPAIEALDLLERACAVPKEERRYREEFPALFTGLGRL